MNTDHVQINGDMQQNEVFICIIDDTVNSCLKILVSGGNFKISETRENFRGEPIIGIYKVYVDKGISIIKILRQLFRVSGCLSDNHEMLENMITYVRRDKLKATIKTVKKITDLMGGYCAKLDAEYGSSPQSVFCMSPSSYGKSPGRTEYFWDNPGQII